MIVERLLLEVRSAQARGITDLDAIGELHVTTTADRLLADSRLVADQVIAGRCAVVAATYSLAHGRVRIASRQLDGTAE